MKDLNKSTFPSILVILASAGTGKTHNLSTRIARYLLADKSNVPFNDLRNILAITFTINASKEMKGRVLKWLKGLSLKDQESAKFLEISQDKIDDYSKRAEALVNKILDNYKDFQIKTIDSFLASIFKASATEFGYSPKFDVALDNREYLESAFDLYLDELKDLDNDFFKFLDFINDNEQTFSFTPYKRIFETVKSLYEKERHFPQGFTNVDREKEWLAKKEELKALLREIREFIDKKGLKKYLSEDGLLKMLSDLENDHFEDFFIRGDNKKPYRKEFNNEPWARDIDKYWEEIKKKRQEAIRIYSENFFFPYIKVLKSFEEKIDFIKKVEEVIFIEDIPKIILENLNSYNIPDVYIRLGGRLYHYFIDEFQDTSPIQWENLFLLIDNSLSSGGSLYVVGDTKQAIYGFRDTDYRIMKGLYEKKITFPSVNLHQTEKLDRNFRSGRAILQYVKDVLDSAKMKHEDYGGSGLFEDWKVEVREDKKGKGYVNAKVLYNQNDIEEPKERAEILDIIQDCVSRGYTYSDITILAHKNKNIVEISSWLNQNNPPIPFISYSSLDIRERRVIKEIINLLKFLDCPRDNLSFSKFLMGDICERVFDQNKIKDFIFRHRNSYFLYKDFEREFRELWERYFEKPFKFVGYLPIYELLCLIINTFYIEENFSDESGAVAKLLEVVKDLEVMGKNSLKEFLNFIDSKEDNEYASTQIFELPIPENFDGVKLMTVHKAKGLSSKVLIYLVYELGRQQDSLKIYEDNNKGIKVMKINKNYRNEDLKSIYNELETKQKVNDLNCFYVGLTRAEDELYVIGVDKDKGDQRAEDRNKKKFPVDLIIEGEFGEKIHRVESKKNIHETKKGLTLILSNKLNIQNKGTSKLNFYEKRRGDYIHSILAEIYNVDDIVKIEEIAKRLNIEYPEFDPIMISKDVGSFINNEAIKPFFEVKRENVFLEKNFADLDGVIRIDRLILNEEEVLIVDFKTGEIEEGYRQQLERYSKALKDIYGKKVSGYILYFDKKEAIKIYEC